MGVQVGVAGTGVEVVEGRRDQSCDIDLRNGSVSGGCAGASGCNLAFHECNYLRNCRVVRLPYQRLRPCIRDRPQRGCRFRDREGEVEPGHRPSCLPLGLLRLDLRDRISHRTGRHS